MARKVTTKLYNLELTYMASAAGYAPANMPLTV